jgi:C1A family cysteine protease
MTTLTFPQNPTVGQQWVAENAVTYTWLGDHWNSVTAISNGTVKYYNEGGGASFEYTPLSDGLLDGGLADGSADPGPGPGPLPGYSKFHWRADRPDPRDHIWQMQPLSAIPTSIDLRQYAQPVEDQGQLGSCTGNAIAEAIEIVDKKNSKNLEISRLFIYYQERLLEGTVNQDNGAYIRDGIKACYTYGAPVESLWPYDTTKFKVKPSNAAYTDAANRKVTGYQRCADFAAVKNALATGNPVVVGFLAYSSFYNITSNGIMPYPNVNTEQLLGGHAVCIVGYNDNFGGITGNGRFICKNSWGRTWGNNGYFYMPYQVIQNTAMSQDFWVINGVRNP